MRTHSLMKLVALTAAVIVAAGLTLFFQQRSEVVRQPQPLIDTLDARVNDITRIKIAQGGGQERLDVELARTDAGWVLAGRDGYPATIEPIRQFLLSLARTSRIEEKASDAEFLGPLGLGPSAGLPSSIITLHAGEEQFAQLEVGGPTPDGLGQYVRMLADGSVWLTDAPISIDPTVPAWTDTDVLRLGSDFLSAIRVQPAGEDAFTVTKVGSGLDATYSIDPMPELRELGQPSSFVSLFASTAMLTFTDVRQRSEVLPPDRDIFTYTTTTDSSFTIHAWREDDEFGATSTWIALDITGQRSGPSQLDQWVFEITPFAAEIFATDLDTLTFETEAPVDAGPSLDDLIDSAVGPAPE